MSPTQEAAMRMALEALATVRCDALYEQDCNVCNAEEALKAALAEPVQEPPIWEQLAKIGNDALEAGALAEPQEPPIGKASTDVGVPVFVVKKAEPQEPVQHEYEVTANDDGTFSVALPDGEELRIIPPQRPAEHDTDCHAQGICQRSGYSIK